MKLKNLFKKKKQNINKYENYNPASNGASMKPFADWIKERSTLEIHNIFEIGANFAQDADYLADAFKVKPENVYVFEAHPDLYKAITKIHKFKAYNNAVFNENKIMNFNIVPASSANTGLSSLLPIPYDTNAVQIQAIRMDDFMNKNQISKIDFLKLDVEGCNWEALDGFGDRLKDVNAVHVEAEHVQKCLNMVDTKLYTDIKEILEKNNFELIYFQRLGRQSDSFWIQKKFLKVQ